MTSRLSAQSLRKGLKAPSVHIGPSRPGAPPSATGSSSSATSASGLTAPQGYGARGGRTMSMASSGYGQSSNQPSREHEEPSRPPLPAPLQRASTTSALTSSRAPLGGATGGLLGGGVGLGMSSMKTDNIRVVLRIRPGRKSSNGNQYEDPDEYDDGDGNQGSGATRRCLEVAESGAGVTIGPGSMQEKRFAFDRVFDDTSSQEDIFQDTGLMAVENTLNGFNGCIFAYGQTGSGKTFTMLGGGDSGSQNDGHELKVSPLRGLMPRIFDHLIRRLEDLVADGSNDLEYTLSCSYLEIYNEKVFDLLEFGSAAAQQPKSLREDSTKKTVYVDQLRQIPIKSATEAIEWLQIGSRNRRMASTDMNRESSRSHAVFTIRLLQTHHTERGVLITRRSNLHLVDLAGSEKQRQTKAAGQRLKEAAQINKSLSALGNVIMALVDVSNGLKRHVHYRDSKLTFLLRDSLGGNSITTIIGTISAEEKYFSETLSTLKFAQRAKFIKNKAVQNEDSDAIIPLLKHEIERLRQEIEALKQNSQSDDGSPHKKSSEHESSYPQPYGAHPIHNGEVAARPRANKWEPALEMMERLLKASGAAVPENGENEQDIFILELRCQRLEMLLYRMICRFEEQKVMTFSGARARPGIVQPPTPTISRAPSMLRKPKIKVGRNDGQDDDARSTRSTRSTASTSNNNADVEQELYEQTNRNAELDAENSLLRQQLAEFMEWKSLVMDERRRSSIGSFNPTAAAPQGQPQASNGGADVQELLEEQRERNEELLEALNGYRSMFADLNTALDEKRYRESTSSPSASGSTYGDDRSVSGVSVLDDDIESVASEDNSADLDEDVFGSEREMRRIQNLSIKFDRRIEKYQDKIQQLERSLLSVQDELETSTAATKFAQFQLEQFRNSASRQEDIELELGELRDKYRRLNKKTVDLERELSAKQVEVDGAFAKVHETDELLRKLEEENSARKEEIKKLRGSSSTTEPEMDSPVLTTHSNQIDDEEGDRPLVSALRRIRELEEQIHRQRSSSIASSLNGSLLDHEVTFSESRVRAQSTSAVGMTGLSEYEIKSSFETHQQLQKVLHGVLADNTDLIKTVRELQTEKGTREQEHMKEVARLREECDSLRKRLDEMRELAVTSISPSKQAKVSGRPSSAGRAVIVQKAETDVLVARLRSERKALQTRLHQAQQQVRNLEDELTRSQSINATRSSIAADFFCEM